VIRVSQWNIPQVALAFCITKIRDTGVARLPNKTHEKGGLGLGPVGSPAVPFGVLVMP
jgi:hypothetical protein